MPAVMWSFTCGGTSYHRCHSWWCLHGKKSSTNMEKPYVAVEEPLAWVVHHHVPSFYAPRQQAQPVTPQAVFV